ncbi:MAG TPA: ABC transporter ATP-binding protein [Thermodesulfobacteriota bacterium]|nr:ABC transporter ATP-binding protein [Thermodesulfobacteriota bacterium]HNU70302.1 ABC transporter ATP-binding protein [Thermodesulfobacteriota bacterium]
MPDIHLKAVTNHVLDDVTLTVNDKELLVLLGPTGAGKTTLLNAIAGLVPHEGSVFFDDVAIDALPPGRRAIGYLFQQLALFPHLNVEANIAYGLRSNGTSEREIQQRVDELLHLMRIEHLAHRYSKTLSGGEKQRVALARALAICPRVLLLDEPLSSTDMRFSKHFRMEFRRLQKQLAITTLYVTHDFSEAEEMGDRVAVMHQGRVEQVGTYQEIFFTPRTKGVSTFIGEPNIFDCDYVRPLGHDFMEVGVKGIPIVIHHHENRVSKIAIQPSHIMVYNQSPPGPDINTLRGRVVEVLSEDFLLRLTVQVGEAAFLVELPRDVGEEMEVAVGKELFLVLRLRWIKAFTGG